MFDGDIRKQEVQEIMNQVKRLSLAQMKLLYRQIAQHHDAIVLSIDPKWQNHHESCGK